MSSTSDVEFEDMEGFDTVTAQQPQESVNEDSKVSASSVNASQDLAASGLQEIHYHFHLDGSDSGKAVMAALLQQSLPAAAASLNPLSPAPAISGIPTVSPFTIPNAPAYGSTPSLPVMPSHNSLMQVIPQPSPTPSKRMRGRPTTESKIKEAVEAALRAQAQINGAIGAQGHAASAGRPSSVSYTLAGPSYAAASPSSAVAGPWHGVAGPWHGVAGPSHGVAGPSHGVAGPSHGVAGPSHGVEGSSSALPGPSRAPVGRLCKVCGLAGVDHFLTNCGHQVHKNCLEPLLKFNPMCPAKFCGASCTLGDLRKIRGD